MFSGLSRSVSAVPGAAPRWDTPPGTPSPSTRITVQPVGRPVIVCEPTLMPCTSVRPRPPVGFKEGERGWVCDATSVAATIPVALHVMTGLSIGISSSSVVVRADRQHYFRRVKPHPHALYSATRRLPFALPRLRRGLVSLAGPQIAGRRLRVQNVYLSAN